MAFYWARFGTGAPSSSSGLNPTFITFVNSSGQTLAPPSIAELFPGTGLYGFSYAPSVSVAFTLDGATTGLAPAVRYVSGSLNPQDDAGQTIIAQGSTITAQVGALATYLVDFGASFIDLSTAIGSTASSFGDDVTDPTTVFGFLKRSQEFWEGNEAYIKNTGALQFFTRGSTTALLREKQISDSTVATTKT